MSGGSRPRSIERRLTSMRAVDRLARTSRPSVAVIDARPAVDLALEFGRTPASTSGESGRRAGSERRARPVGPEWCPMICPSRLRVLHPALTRRSPRPIGPVGASVSPARARLGSCGTAGRTPKRPWAMPARQVRSKVVHAGSTGGSTSTERRPRQRTICDVTAATAVGTSEGRPSRAGLRAMERCRAADRRRAGRAGTCRPR